MFVRPCFLVVDPEHGGSISTRKLVLETAKFNVITAYSCAEAEAVLERFPGMHGVILNSSMPDGSAAEFARKVRAQLPEAKLIIVGDQLAADVEVDTVVSTYSPGALLEATQRLFPEQRKLLDLRENELNERDQ